MTKALILCSLITIDGNVVEHACTDIWQECLTLASTDVFEIKNNEVFDCQEEGIDVKDDASNGQVYRNHVHDVGAIGIYIDAWDRHTHDIAVFQNRIHHVSEYNGIALASDRGLRSAVLLRARLFASSS